MKKRYDEILEEYCKKKSICMVCGKDLGDILEHDGSIVNTCVECFDRIFPEVDNEI